MATQAKSPNAYNLFVQAAGKAAKSLKTDDKSAEKFASVVKAATDSGFPELVEVLESFYDWAASKSSKSSVTKATKISMNMLIGKNAKELPACFVALENALKSFGVPYDWSLRARIKAIKVKTSTTAFGLAVQASKSPTKENVTALVAHMRDNKSHYGIAGGSNMLESVTATADALQGRVTVKPAEEAAADKTEEVFVDEVKDIKTGQYAVWTMQDERHPANGKSVKVSKQGREYTLECDGEKTSSTRRTVIEAWFEVDATDETPAAEEPADVQAETSEPAEPIVDDNGNAVDYSTPTTEDIDAMDVKALVAELQAKKLPTRGKKVALQASLKAAYGYATA